MGLVGVDLPVKGWWLPEACVDRLQGGPKAQRRGHAEPWGQDTLLAHRLGLLAGEEPVNLGSTHVW